MGGHVWQHLLLDMVVYLPVVERVRSMCGACAERVRGGAYARRSEQKGSRRVQRGGSRDVYTNVRRCHTQTTAALYPSLCPYSPWCPSLCPAPPSSAPPLVSLTGATPLVPHPECPPTPPTPPSGVLLQLRPYLPLQLQDARLQHVLLRRTGVQHRTEVVDQLLRLAPRVARGDGGVGGLSKLPLELPDDTLVLVHLRRVHRRCFVDLGEPPLDTTELWSERRGVRGGRKGGGGRKERERGRGRGGRDEAVAR